MAMMAVVYWLHTGEPMAQAIRLGPTVGGHLVLCYIHYEPGELLQRLCHDDSTVNIIMLIVVDEGGHVFTSVCLSLCPSDN